MPYQITKKEPIETSLKKILVLGIKDATSVLSLSRGLHREQFKQARKSLKKARAVLFLLRGAIPDEKFGEEEKTLRDLSRTFREVREAYVTEEVFQRFCNDNKNKVQDEDIKEITHFLVAKCAENVDKVFQKEKKLKEAIGLLTAAMERIPEIKIKGDIWESIEEAIRSIYSECAELGDFCQDSDDENTIIAWRKAVKFLHVELDFFEEGFSSEIKKWNRKLLELSDCLGEFQDLTMIQDQLDEGKKEIKNKKSLDEVVQLIKSRKKSLKKIAREIGREVFSQKPKAFMKQFSSATLQWFKAA
ncbi:MAG: CHAD domain-containing protein [Deltaproteobacteria bacterium]|nr:CHAD domain-containing protein [Deltaproteobacteria bacterium]